MKLHQRTFTLPGYQWIPATSLQTGGHRTRAGADATVAATGVSVVLGVEGWVTRLESRDCSLLEWLFPALTRHPQPATSVVRAHAG